MTKSLYRFFPYNAHDLDALANNYLWFSSYSDFNDPFEDLFVQNAIHANLGDYDQDKVIALYQELHKNDKPKAEINDILIELISKNKLRSYHEEHVNNIVTFTKTELNHHIQNSKACCLVFDNIDKGEMALENKLMWSHYGNGLRGFCVEYDYAQLIKSLFELAQQEVGLCPMEYKELKKHSFIDLYLNWIRKDSQEINIASLVATKSPEWSYENEFRLIVKDKGNINHFSSSVIKSVTFGEKIPEGKLTTLLSVLRGNGDIKCDVYCAYIDVDSFKIKRKFHSESV